MFVCHQCVQYSLLEMIGQFLGFVLFNWPINIRFLQITFGTCHEYFSHPPVCIANNQYFTLNNSLLQHVTKIVLKHWLFSSSGSISFFFFLSIMTNIYDTKNRRLQLLIRYIFRDHTIYKFCRKL